MDTPIRRLAVVGEHRFEASARGLFLLGTLAVAPSSCHRAGFFREDVELVQRRVSEGASGSLDDSFGADGIAWHGSPEPGSDDLARDIVLHGEGLLALAEKHGPAQDDVLLWRLGPTGQPDADFGDGRGAITIDAAGRYDTPHALLIRAGGAITVAMAEGGDFGLLGRQADGQPDLAFGVAGFSEHSVSGADYLYAIAPHAGGIITAGIVSTGPSGESDVAVVRWTADGRLEAGFGSGGVASIGDSLEWEKGFGVAVDPTDDGIVVAGQYGTRILVVRFQASGVADGNFGPTGDGLLRLTEPRFSASAAAVVRQPDDGKLLVGGWGSSGSGLDWTALRLWPGGDLDSTFGTNGLATVDFEGGDDRAHDLALLADGRIVLVGSATVAGQRDLAVAVLTNAGQLDASFDHDGRATVDLGSAEDEATGVVIQPDGKIVVLGTLNNGTDVDLAVLRFWP